MKHPAPLCLVGLLVPVFLALKIVGAELSWWWLPAIYITPFAIAEITQKTGEHHV